MGIVKQMRRWILKSKSNDEDCIEVSLQIDCVTISNIKCNFNLMYNRYRQYFGKN